MKRFAILLALLAGMHSAGAQPCLPEGIFLSTQQQINAFRTNYAECTEIGGDVVISGFNIVNLQGLSNITHIGGSLSILCNEALPSLAGLENLVSIGGNLYLEGNLVLPDLTGLNNLAWIGADLQCTDNPVLTSFAGLGSLTWLPGRLWIEDNPSLTSLSGLDNVEGIGGCLRVISNQSLPDLAGLGQLHAIGGDLRIGGEGHLGGLGNPSLESLAALSGLLSVGGVIEVAWNPLLPSLAGLDQVTGGTIGALLIYENQSLSECEVNGICAFLANPTATVVIYSNAPGCNSPAEVRDACELLALPGTMPTTQVKLYPNPVTDMATLRAPGLPDDTRVTLFNAFGKNIWSGVIMAEEVRIAMSSLPSGLYLLRLNAGYGPATLRVVKE